MPGSDSYNPRDPEKAADVCSLIVMRAAEGRYSSLFPDPYNMPPGQAFTPMREAARVWEKVAIAARQKAAKLRQSADEAETIALAGTRASSLRGSTEYEDPEPEGPDGITPKAGS